MTIGILKGKEVSVLPPENIHTNEQTNIYTIKQTNIHTNEQTNKFSRRKVHIWLWAEPDDNDLHQLHWLAQVSPL